MQWRSPTCRQIYESISRHGRTAGAQRLPRIGKSRRLLQLEHLENRCLLSASAGPDFLEVRGLQLDAQAHAADRILVRFHDDAQPAAGLKGERLMRGLNLWRVDLDRDVAVADAVADFRGRPDVLYAHPDYTVHTQEWHASDPPNPNDALYQAGMLWGLNNTGSYEGTADADIDAPDAWRVNRGAGVTVAVIDTGIDYTHPDLQGRMWVNPGEIRGNGLDDDGNGYVDDLYGYDFANGDSDPKDDQGHGTHVAGTIAAAANNDIGDYNDNTGLAIIGVAPEAQLMALKFLDAAGYGSTSNAIRALDYAINMGVRISNNSYGGSPFEQVMLDAINRAADAGHLFVAAAGNGNWRGIGQNNDSTPSYPASYVPQDGRPDTVIAVAASNSSDGYGGFSNYGATSVDLAAPGVHIWSTYPLAKDTSDGTNEGYARKDGTSMATPHVAAAAALVWSASPGLSALAVKDILLGTVDPISGKDTVTDGRLNTGRAVAAAGSPTNTPPIAAADSAGTNEDLPVMINLLANDADADGQPLTVTNLTQPESGAIVRNADQTVTYTPAANFHGTDSFTYTVFDGLAHSAPSTVTISVAALNDAPVAVADTYNMTQGQTLTIPAPGVLGNDFDVDADALTAALVSGPANGALTFNSDGSFSYLPNGSFVGTVSFVYSVSDGLGGIAQATSTINVSPSASPSDMYVWDIGFESRTKGNKHDERVRVSIRRDSNANGLTESADAPVSGATVKVVINGPKGGTFTGTSDSNGVFITNWLTNVPNGTYIAEVISLAHSTHVWKGTLDPTTEDGDADGDGLPDQVHVIPHTSTSTGTLSVSSLESTEWEAPRLAESTLFSSTEQSKKGADLPRMGDPLEILLSGGLSTPSRLAAGGSSQLPGAVHDHEATAEMEALDQIYSKLDSDLLSDWLVV